MCHCRYIKQEQIFSEKCGETGSILPNAKFLRPLLAVAANGAISILDANGQLNPRARSGFSLVQLTQCSLLGMEDTSLERIFIKSDLLNLFMDAAVEGCHIVEDRLAVLVERWKETLGLSIPSPLTSLVPEQTLMSDSGSPRRL